jgi:DnaJ-class molecular chaperone
MMQTPIEEIEKALEILDLPKMVTKADIKRQYRYIAKKHHPDLGGDPQEMERINYAYRLLMKYIEEFRYTFDENEVSKQFPGAQHAEQFKP